MVGRRSKDKEKKVTMIRIYKNRKRKGKNEKQIEKEGEEWRKG